jgi:hypothetical protein
MMLSDALAQRQTKLLYLNHRLFSVSSSCSGFLPSLDHSGPEARLRASSRTLSQSAFESVATSCGKFFTRDRSNRWLGERMNELLHALNSLTSRVLSD